MTHRLLTKSAFFALAMLAAPLQLSAQSAEEVKSDVLSALSTPLPITIIGPLLTRDVTVTEEGDGFRATLEDTTLMGLYPFGEVSMKLVPLDDDTYRVSDLQFPKDLDFPGMARITFEGMTLDGTWSATDRSYSALKAELTGLSVQPGQGNPGTLSLGRIAFDVEKEPDETDTESRLDITLGNISAKGFPGANVSIGEVQALLSANGERPVDLYSLLREVMMVASARGGRIGPQTLGESILGNTYSTVALDVGLSDLNITDPQNPEGSYFQAAGLQARLGMQDVNPRDWGMVEVSVNLDQVKQQRMMENGVFEVGRARLKLRGAELPVADMFAALNTLNTFHQTQPVRVSDLLDGFLEFGALEFTTEGEALKLEVRSGTFENDKWVEHTEFFTGYDSWNAQLAFEGFNQNQGTITNLIDLQGGTFTPGPKFAVEDLQHIKAWFPVTLKQGGQVSNLNESFLKQLFTDVFIEDIDEPTEIILPLVLYASASAFEVNTEGNRYETDLFSIEQSGAYRFFPAKFMSITPIEGQIVMRMTGFDNLMAYFDELLREEARREYGRPEDMSVLKSVLTVLRNLGTQAEDGTVVWQIEKNDVDRSEIVVNGTTLYYPEFTQLMPFAMFGMFL